MPLPFSRGVFVYGDPIRVPPSTDRDGMESKRRELEEALVRLTERAERTACLEWPAGRPSAGERVKGPR